MRRLFLERSRWLSPRGSLLKKERGTFICWRMSRHPVVPPLHSPVRSVAERRGAACCVLCGCGGGVARSTLSWGRRDTESLAAVATPPSPALHQSPVASRSCSQTLASLALRPPARPARRKSRHFPRNPFFVETSSQLRLHAMSWYYTRNW